MRLFHVFSGFGIYVHVPYAVQRSLLVLPMLGWPWLAILMHCIYCPVWLKIIYILVASYILSSVTQNYIYIHFWVTLDSVITSFYSTSLLPFIHPPNPKFQPLLSSLTLLAKYVIVLILCPLYVVPSLNITLIVFSSNSESDHHHCVCRIRLSSLVGSVSSELQSCWDKFVSSRQSFNQN
jgi:hypothetical protein